ncbi:hypothetical protein Asppvi_008493 [Aspergillus pseudoviridinutans]|uniref:FAD-binding PCMH-type domain-containing protein n=1 Tax=Aspergillus pseudoviridinutans TaxID=1517512 RepID=A0A9P3BDY0_9EURO|nr:uncharacterized protein Asppvi_008493 [Aspergillus pseudoviridinutans]GIJ89551.1 hypothetical protein Asppvi_008493 [Aspergillus pseudoviridinutans]
MAQVIKTLAYLLIVTNAAAYDESYPGYHSPLQTCAQLSTVFGSALHYPDNDNFLIWDAKQQEVHPACRVEPSSATDVAKVLNILVEHWCYFSVKGGGHSRNPGDSNSAGGVTVDLDRMREVQVLDNGTKACVGGGATTFQVYHALESRNLSFVGGRVGTVGVGGYTLGGGTSPLSNKYGWALDNVYEYEVVLANSTVTTASDSHSPDLYFALRGGGNNFGIVTAFIVRTFAHGPVFTSTTSYSANQTEEVLDKVYELYTGSGLTSDVELGYDLYYTYVAGSDEFVLTGTQRYGKPVQKPPVFQAIDQIPTLSRVTTIGSLASLVNESSPMGATRNWFATLTVSPSRSLLSQALQIFSHEVEAIKSVPDLVPNFICYPLQRNAIAAMKHRGGNALGIERDEPLFTWSHGRDDAAVERMSVNVVRRLQAAAENLGVANRYLYVNYASAAQTDAFFAGYGTGNMRRLREIQRAVDPDGIFTSKGLWKGFVKLL